MNEWSHATELPWLWAGLAAYALATFMSFRGVMATRGGAAGAAVNRSYETPVFLLIIAGVMLLAMALAERWMRIGHGPFVNLFELLMSQLFSLGLVFTFAYWRFPLIRPSAVVALPLMWILGVWVLRNIPRFDSWFRLLPADAVVDHIAWRFMLMAFIFHSAMLIAGAVWAQDAWGRYWSWDALETSSFLTWLALGGAIHARLTYRLPMRAGAIFIIVVFVLAFLTYFGTPFYSEAAHKGVI